MRCYHGSSSGPISCCCGWRIRSYATNGLAVPTRDAAPPAAKAGWSRHPKAVVVTSGHSLFPRAGLWTERRSAQQVRQHFREVAVAEAGVFLAGQNDRDGNEILGDRIAGFAAQAALMLAQRSLGCSERLRVAPVGTGVQVAFNVPARKRVKHVWTYWGAISGQLRPALAAQHRLGKRRRRPNPVQAVVRADACGVACTGTRSVFPGEISGRGAILNCWRGVDRIFRNGWRWFVTKGNHF